MPGFSEAEPHFCDFVAEEVFHRSGAGESILFFRTNTEFRGIWSEISKNGGISEAAGAVGVRIGLANTVSAR